MGTDDGPSLFDGVSKQGRSAGRSRLIVPMPRAIADRSMENRSVLTTVVSCGSQQIDLAGCDGLNGIECLTCSTGLEVCGSAADSSQQQHDLAGVAGFASSTGVAGFICSQQLTEPTTQHQPGGSVSTSALTMAKARGR